MHIDDAISGRRSVRGYLPQEIPQPLLEEMFSLARHAPSNCNVQPWRTLVVSGSRKDALVAALTAELQAEPKAGPEPDFGPTMLSAYDGVLRERQHGSARGLYEAMGITREDKAGRAAASLRNWQFFDAPHVAFFTMERTLGMRGAIDLGIYAQTLSLVMTSRGIASCMQASLGYFTYPIRRALDIPDNLGILFGMSFGYADEACAANACKTSRANLCDSVRFY